MKWGGFLVLALMGLAYFALALEASTILAGIGYTLAAVLWLAAVANLYKPRK
jgi:hypothetical protein